MWSLLRCALIWLMVFAMPVQGMAVSTMALCGPVHERMALSPAAADHDGQAVPAQEQSDRTLAPAAAAWPDDARLGTDDLQAPVTNGFGHLDMFSCSACASCCSTLAMPVGLPLVGDPDVADTTPAALAVGVRTFFAEGPERPPRARLA